MQYRVEKDKGCKSCPLTMNANITAFIPGWICDKDGSPCDSPIAKKNAALQAVQPRLSGHNQ